MNPDEPTSQAPATPRTTPPAPRPRPVAAHGTLLGHLILHSAFHRPR
ncbi:hypothetical protein [Nocardia asiatica]|nr:hypothetical protein [Nocardia asiatica]